MSLWFYFICCFEFVKINYLPHACIPTFVDAVIKLSSGKQNAKTFHEETAGVLSVLHEWILNGCLNVTFSLMEAPELLKRQGGISDRGRKEVSESKSSQNYYKQLGISCQESNQKKYISYREGIIEKLTAKCPK